ncbi:MAG: zinc transporter ZupT [Lentisphaeria bacterium]|nr:zinc transporter ZupT [Lentisphaeria bacterium]
MDILIALGLTAFAGLATGIGSFLAFFAKRRNGRFLAISTGFSAGVMLYVSFVEIFFKGAESLHKAYGEVLGNWVNVASFFGGILLIALIDHFIPSAENPHEVHSREEMEPLHNPLAEEPDFQAIADHPDMAPPGGHDHRVDSHKLLRMGMFTALAIGIHNFPEGLATFLAALEDPGVGAVIAVAIALHNIPEGMSVSVPIYYATGNRKKAFFYSFLSGLAEPVGAIIAYVLIRLFLGSSGGGIPPQIMGVLFAGVAGIMVYISLDELLPTSRAYGKGHDSVLGLGAGMLVMAVSLLLMQ